MTCPVSFPAAVVALVLVAALPAFALANEDGEVLGALYRIQASARICNYEMPDVKKAQLATAVASYENRSRLDGATFAALKSASTVGIPVDPGACAKDVAFTASFKATLVALDGLPIGP